MHHAAQKVIQSLKGEAELTALAHGLLAMLTADLNDGRPFTESRARALLRATNALDDATSAAFLRLLTKEVNVRLALYDLLDSCDLPSNQIPHNQLAAGPALWLPLILAAHAHKSGYPLSQLDPASPPASHSPAGMLVQQAAHFIRRQTLRTATERDRLGRKLAFNAAAAQPLDSLPEAAETIAPIPPHFRSPVPVRYPEYNPPVQVEAADLAAPLHRPDEPTQETLPQRGAALKITAADVAQARPHTAPQPAPQPARRSQPRPRPTPQSSPSAFSTALRNLFKTEQMKTTKLRVLVQEYPDGPGLYGLQVKVSCRGIKSYVAGTTDRNGRFLCELPVRLTSGLTYDVDVTWPRDIGGDTERKSITLNADRTEFQLPFYQRHASA